MGASASALLYKISWSPGYGTIPAYTYRNDNRL
jgi:hypothetical protein